VKYWYKDHQTKKKQVITVNAQTFRIGIFGLTKDRGMVCSCRVPRDRDLLGFPFKRTRGGSPERSHLGESEPVPVQS
jgi:hypothetical protein